MHYEHRKFIIFDTTEINIINFSEVLETSVNTLRYSVDGTKTFVKWDDDIEPPCISNLTTKQGPYDYDTMMSILDTSEWVKPNPFI